MPTPRDQLELSLRPADEIVCASALGRPRLEIDQSPRNRPHLAEGLLGRRIARLANTHGPLATLQQTIMTSAQLPTLTVDEILEQACARNTPAELYYEPARGDRLIFRVRLIALTETQILTDKPAGRAGDRAIPANKPITVHFQFKGERRQFGSVVVASEVDVRLNDSKTVRGIALRKPSSTAESQRRTDFRQSLAACDPIAVTMVPPATDAPNACLLDAPRATGQLVQISAGGAAVTIKRALLPKLQSDMPFFLSFELPELDEAFCMLALTRHIRELHNGESLRIGWEFTDWGARRLTVDQRRIARFVATYQRKTLRHRT